MTGGPAAGESTWERRLAWLIVGVALVRLAFLFAVDVDLAPDEAYYWDWGREPAWGYFSKPPMIAWVYAAARMLGAETTSWIRLPAVILGIGTLIFASLLVRRMAGARTAFWSVLLLALAPGTLVSNLVLTIDAPLLLSWTAALCGLWMATNPRRDGTRNPDAWWLCAGAIGAGVLSKQMMLLFPVLAFAWLALEPSARRHLRDWRTWLGLVAPLAALIPVLAWNARHDWITVHHTAGHFGAKAWSLSRSVSSFGGFIGIAMVLVGPVIAVAFVVAAFRVARTWQAAEPAERFLWIFSVPALVAVLTMSLFRRVHPNWPAVFWEAGALLAVRFVVAPQNFRWHRHALWSAGTLSALVLLLPALIPLTGQAMGRTDVLARLRGWREFAAQVQEIRNRFAADGRRPDVWAATERGVVSELAFYLPDQPRVRRWSVTGRVESQYEIWPAPAPDGRDWIILTRAADPGVPPELAARFRSVERAGEVVYGPDTRRARRYPVWIARDYAGHW